jgi:hypothetical protein
MSPNLAPGAASAPDTSNTSEPSAAWRPTAATVTALARLLRTLAQRDRDAGQPAAAELADAEEVFSNP